MTIVIDTPVPVHAGRGHSHPDEILVRNGDNTDFLREVLGDFTSIQYLSRTGVDLPVLEYNQFTKGTSLGMQTVHGCFATHANLTLSPTYLWYLIVSEVATFVKANASDYAHLFTQTPGEKQKIVVQDDSLRHNHPSDWGLALELFRAPLVEAIGAQGVHDFLPPFGTNTLEDEIALLVAFMDTVSPYYGYGVQTLCGIPQIKLEGEADDWQLLLTATVRLQTLFPALDSYFTDLVKVLTEVIKPVTTGSIDTDFWRSIYKLGGGSGGPYVNGWITAFFAHVQTHRGQVLKQHFDWERTARDPFGGTTTDGFPSHVSVVPFEWDYFGQIIPMHFAAGILGVDEQDGFFKPQLGYAVIEKAAV